jgi:hypothetical protein
LVLPTDSIKYLKTIQLIKNSSNEAGKITLESLASSPEVGDLASLVKAVSDSGEMTDEEKDDAAIGLNILANMKKAKGKKE